MFISVNVIDGTNQANLKSALEQYAVPQYFDSIVNNNGYLTCMKNEIAILNIGSTLSSASGIKNGFTFQNNAYKFGLMSAPTMKKLIITSFCIIFCYSDDTWEHFIITKNSNNEVVFICPYEERVISAGITTYRGDTFSSNDASRKYMLYSNNTPFEMAGYKTNSDGLDPHFLGSPLYSGISSEQYIPKIYIPTIHPYPALTVPTIIDSTAGKRYILLREAIIDVTDEGEFNEVS